MTPQLRQMNVGEDALAGRHFVGRAFGREAFAWQQLAPLASPREPVLFRDLQATNVFSSPRLFHGNNEHVMTTPHATQYAGRAHAIHTYTRFRSNATLTPREQYGGDLHRTFIEQRALSLCGSDLWGGQKVIKQVLEPLGSGSRPRSNTATTQARETS